MKPLLQIALDATSLSQALNDLNVIGKHVDIIEVGTVLAFAEGTSALKTIRQAYPNHCLVCDMKIVDAGETLAKMAFEQGANWVTVSAAAHRETMRSALNVANQYGGEIQIELFGNWTLSDAKNWYVLGIKQAIYHRSRDAQAAGASWSQADINMMKTLSDIGIEVSITGGIIPGDVHLFKDILVKVFIAGRALANQNGETISQQFRQEINHYW